MGGRALLSSTTMNPQRPNNDPSVWSEPHLRGTPIDLGAGDALSDEPARAGEPHRAEDDDRAPDGTPNHTPDLESSVRDEPSMAWNRAAIATIDGYGALLTQRLASTPLVTRWLIVALIALASGPFGVFGAFFSAFTGPTGLGLLAVTVIAPVVEEMTKVALLVWLVERKPWLLPSAGAVVVAGLLSGAVFGAIENVIYLTVYFPDRAAEIAPWRWFATAPMHTVASAIAAVGVARMWSAVMRERTPARITIAYPWIVAAMVLHGAFNSMAILLELVGVAP